MFRSFKIFTVSITILAVILPSLSFIPDAYAQSAPPPQAQVSFTDVLIGGVSCSVGGILAQWVINKLYTGVQILSNLSSTLSNVFNWLGIFNLFTQNVPTMNAVLEGAKNYGDVVGRCFARQIMNGMTGRMIGAVRTSGRNGGPAFVRSWRNFQIDAEHRGENLFRSILGGTNLCSFFSGDLKNVFNANNQPNLNFYGGPLTRTGNLDPFNLRAGCTMGANFSMGNYRNNFAGNGGWNTLSRLAEPQNNYYGSMLLSMAELQAQRALESGSDVNQAVSGLGFTSRTGYGPEDSCLLRASNGSCIVFKNILTPGSALQGTAVSVVQEELAWLTNVNSLQGIISDLTSTLMSRVLNLAAPDERQQEPYKPEPYPPDVPNPEIPCPTTPTGPGGLPYPPEDPGNPKPYPVSVGVSTASTPCSTVMPTVPPGGTPTPTPVGQTPTPTPVPTPIPTPPSSFTCNETIQRYYNGPDHYQHPDPILNPPPLGYSYDGPSFIVLSATVPGYTQELHSCFLNGDHMLASGPNPCGTYGDEGVIGYLVSSPMLNANTPIYRCYVPSSNAAGIDHYSTLSSTCENAPNAASDGIQGYICP